MISEKTFYNYLKSNSVEKESEKKRKSSSEKFALLSKLAYFSNDKNKLEKNAQKNGYYIDKELSNQNVTIFSKGKNVIISFRGTKLDNLDDLNTDLDIVNNNQKQSRRFQEALDIAELVESKYGQEKIYVTGHSLGGSVAIFVNENYNYDCIVYNPGSNPLISQKVNDNVIIYRNENDIISNGFNISENADNIITIESNQNFIQYITDYITNGIEGILFGLGNQQLEDHALDQFLEDEIED